MSDERRSIAVALGYFAAEMALDGFVLWLLYSRGHPWWSLTYAIFAGMSANRGTKRFLGIAPDETSP